MAQRTCSECGCEEPHRARGFCIKHYEAASVAGLLPPRAVRAPQESQGCSVEGCEEPHRTYGYCNKHYQRWKKHGDPLMGAKERHTCTVEDCDRGVQGHGYCPLHYKRWRKTGDPLRGRLTGEERFWTAVNKNGPVSAHRPDLGPCWLWTRPLNDGGYGKFMDQGVYWAAHRFSYTVSVGPIPDGLHLDHLCRVRHCVNPSHLEPVTCQVNLLRGVGFVAVNAKKTHCPQGHEYDEANTLHLNGRRHCVRCRKDQGKGTAA